MTYGKRDDKPRARRSKPVPTAHSRSGTSGDGPTSRSNSKLGSMQGAGSHDQLGDQGNPGRRVKGSSGKLGR